ncbi:MAG: Vacuolar protein sorting-associated protein 20 [Pycnora praestabilis]|nr:MAG: Vacuolar protein sorting-associated protein 20 [Pycnora praestabilis]
MGNTPSSHKISAQDRAILDMKIQRDKLHQYQKRITIITDREKAVAKECLSRGDKPKALLALRRKKYQESLLSKTDAQLEQLEQLTSSVEFALVQKDVVFGLQQGTSVLKEIHKEIGGLENVEKLMGESEEARQYQREVSEMLGGRISNQDEDEVEDELDALEREVNRTKLPDAPATELPEDELERTQTEARRAKARAKAREQATSQASEPMLA